MAQPDVRMEWTGPETARRLRQAADMLLARWRFIVAAVVLAWVVTATLSLSRPRRYAAEATLAAISSRMNLGAAGLAASLIGANAMLGLEATPAFLVRLARLDGVLVPVGLMVVDSATGERMIDRLEDEDPGAVPLSRVGRVMRERCATTYDMQSGLISIRVQHKDSALARRVVNAVTAQLGTVFSRAARAQATELRRGQEQRVDSAVRRLREAEEALLTFTRRHRVVTPYSEASLEEQRLQRGVSLAQSVYQQAVMEREAALAKELQETPALVVVDPPAPVLPPVPRGTATRLVLVTFAALALAGAWVLLGGVAGRRTPA